MKIYAWKDMTESERRALMRRPASDSGQSALKGVREILDSVRRDGDRALRDLTKKYDGYDPEPLFVPITEILGAGERIGAPLRQAMDKAYENVLSFHRPQGYKPVRVEVLPGLTCERNVVPVESVGLYIPGGTAPLFSTALMLGVPSQIAGNPARVMCTPADKNGSVHPAILYAAFLCGIDRVARVGGAQAIAAMAYGTQSMARADRIFGPGNIYVTLAKMLVAQESGGPGIDMPAGPSEVLVIADESTPAVFAAADLLAQAEHDPSSQVVLIATAQDKAEEIGRAIEEQIRDLPRADIIRGALRGSLSIVVDTLEQAIEISNLYAPEHLILCFETAEKYKNHVKNAGSVFCGLHTPESLGDYASGTNHVLPTAGCARSYSGLGVEFFQKTMTWQTASRAGLEALAPTVINMAQAETLEAHARAVSLRLKEKAA